MYCEQILTKDHAESLNSESPKSLEIKVTVTYGRLTHIAKSPYVQFSVEEILFSWVL